MPTIEEIGGFTGLRYQKRGMILPRRRSGKSFLHHLGLKNNPKLACLDSEWISLDFLYERFDLKDGYEIFKKKFSCSAETWEKKRLDAFSIALLGTFVFLRELGKIDTNIGSMVQTLSRGINNMEVTLVPMILAEIFRVLSKCIRGNRLRVQLLTPIVGC